MQICVTQGVTHRTAPNRTAIRPLAMEVSAPCCLACMAQKPDVESGFHVPERH
jgi:hypothetical protein